MAAIQYPNARDILSPTVRDLYPAVSGKAADPATAQTASDTANALATLLGAGFNADAVKAEVLKVFPAPELAALPGAAEADKVNAIVTLLGAIAGAPGDAKTMAATECIVDIAGLTGDTDKATLGDRVNLSSE